MTVNSPIEGYNFSLFPLKVVKWYFSPIELWLLWPIECSGNANLVPAHWQFLSCSWYQMKVCVPNLVKPMWSQTIQNNEVCSRVRFISAKQEEWLLMLIKPKTSYGFWEEIYRKIGGEDFSVWLSSLIGPWSKRAVF